MAGKSDVVDIVLHEGRPSYEIHNYFNPQGGDSLTPREAEVARLIATGMLNKQIATELNISEQTVKNHVTQTLKKLGVSNRTGVALAMMHGKGVNFDMVQYAQKQISILNQAIIYWERVITENESISV